MRVLCSCNALIGHLHPMLPLADALRIAGHDVAFMSGPDLTAAVGDAGFEFCPVGPSFDEIVGEAFARHPNVVLETPTDQQRFGFGVLFSEVRVGLALADADRAAATQPPDLILNDVGDFVGALLAARRGIPNATIGVGLVLGEQWLELAAQGVAGAWAAAGLSPRRDGGLYRCLYLNQWPSTLQRAELAALPAVHDLRPVTFGTGAPVPPDLHHLGTHRPLVYVTLGTIFGSTGLFDTILDALGPLDVDVLVTTGPAAPTTEIAERHPEATIRSFVPQGAVLPRCRLVITHGGAGSVIGPLSHAVPLIVIPTGADQEENARAVTAAGVGRVTSPTALTPEKLRDLVHDVLADTAITRAAQLTRDHIAAMPAPAAVVPIVEALTNS